MAVTAIWSRKSRLEKLVDYAINPAKTSSAIFTKEELEGMKSIGGGSGQAEKLLHVSYLNCMEDDTAEDMNFVKTRFGKTGGIVAYHGYQSFKPGEVTPDIAHEIGVKLAEKMWGDRFQVVVATHLDHEHIHNHFVINSVSHIDGTKYNENKAEYKRMRETSDELCREYGLSVIGEQLRQEGKKKQYGEWKADRDDRLTWRTLIREDIDRCIANASSFDTFIDNLAAIGYDIKGYKDNLKYISIRPEGKERYVRMTERSLGYGYGEDQISQRIEQGFITGRSQTGHRPSLKTRRNPYTKSYTIIGIYKWFKIEMDNAARDRTENYRQGAAPFPVREELLKFEKFQREYELVLDNDLETGQDLDSFKAQKESDLKYLESKIKEIEKTESSHKEVTILRNEVRKIKYDIRLCDEIYDHSVELENKLKGIQAETEITANDITIEEEKEHDRQ